MNIGVAVITNLTATSASIASANAAVALITTGTVTNLTSTSASIASANLGVALVTTGTVTNLTATGASIASANVGTAVVTGLTVTNASIASLNAGTATVTTGNLTFSSTAQRITGDFSNATVANRLMFQTSTTNGNTFVSTLPNGTGTNSGLLLYGGSDPANSASLRLFANSGSSEAQINSAISGTGTYLPMTFYTGGSERLRIDTSGNVGIVTASPSSFGKFAVQGVNTNRVFYADSLAQPVARYDDNSYISNGFTIRNSGVSGSNQGIGLLFQLGTSGTPVDAGAIQMRSEQDFSSAANQDSAMLFFTVLNGTNAERMRITSAGNIVAGASAALATTATDGFLYVPTCAGTPTGTPTAITGMAPIVVNTTNNKLYFYSGGAWRDAGP
jgi:hypothetical protein